MDSREILYRPTKLFSQSELPALPTVHAIESEQSNSTVIAERAFVLKSYRRLRPGINPEVEIGRFLTDVAGYQNAPALLGSVELVENGEPTALAVLHAFVENQGDGWSFASSYLDRFLEEQRLLTTAPPSETSPHAGFIQRIRQAARRIGELHLALAAHPHEEAFAPEPISAADVSLWSETLVANMEKMFDGLARRRGDLKSDVRGVAEALLGRRDAALSQVSSLLPTQVEGQKIRHHGDLHLGQVLLVKDDIFIIDFEGEPGRTNEERRRKAPAARDVAGFIRSLDYAALAALDRAVKGSPEEQAKLSHALDVWRGETVASFLSSYLDTTGKSDLWPKEQQASLQLLNFFLLEKAVYEVGYELSNRPGWVHVPLVGVWRLLSGMEATP
jgi:maltose alpha-D-glucosyltransferase/alpha-amylase